MVLWRPARPFRINTQKDVLFIIGDWNVKVGSQETPGVTGKFGFGIRNEAGQRLIEFCQEKAVVIANTFFQQHKKRLYTWASSDGQYKNQIDYILCSQRWRSSLQSSKTRPGAGGGSDHELLIAKLPFSKFQIIKLSWNLFLGSLIDVKKPGAYNQAKIYSYNLGILKNVMETEQLWYFWQLD